MANKVKSLLGGPGFYAVLALCVLAVGVGGYFLPVSYTHLTLPTT